MPVSIFLLVLAAVTTIIVPIIIVIHFALPYLGLPTVGSHGRSAGSTANGTANNRAIAPANG